MLKIRNLGAIIPDSLRTDFILKEFEVLGKKKRLLDLGCGVKPFKCVYSNYCESSVGIDVAQTLHGTEQVDVIYDGKKIPFANQEFDIVFCTEVLEHVPEPTEFLNEIFRVLKPHGTLIMTVPFLVPLHEEPHDFFRYTKHALKYMLEKTGYKVKTITVFSEYFGVMISFGVVLQLKFWNVLAKKSHLPAIYSVWNPFIFLFVWLPQAMILKLYKIKFLGKLWKRLGYFPKGYGIIAEK